MKLLTVLVLMLLLQLPVSGQWYYRHHRVEEPSLLSNQQLNYSEKRANGLIAIGVGLDIIGGVIFIGGMSSIEDTDNPGVEVLNAFTGLFYLATAIPFITVGTILIVSGANIKSQINYLRIAKPDQNGTLSILPVMISTQYRGAIPGLSFCLRF